MASFVLSSLPRLPMFGRRRPQVPCFPVCTKKLQRSLLSPTGQSTSARPRLPAFGQALAAVSSSPTPTHTPVYVMLQLDTVTFDGQVNDRDALSNMLNTLTEAKIDGVMVDVWWGIVESEGPRQYNWAGYRELFDLVSSFGLKLQVVMSFHRCGGNVGDTVYIPLPEWIRDIGVSDPNIYFTDGELRRNHECLSWSIDELPVLRKRTALMVYNDFMNSFEKEFKEMLNSGRIVEIEVGLGPCGELRYPSYPEFFGWKYPNVGAFQCYDKYTLDALRSRVEEKGYLGFGWEIPPSTEECGTYNTPMPERSFFAAGSSGGYDSLRGRFFLSFYSGQLLDHADRVLGSARAIFGSTPIAAKVSGIHWHYRSLSHAAELTAGFYNPANRDGYGPIASVLKKHGAALNFTCVELRTVNQDPEALSDPEALVWQVANAGWDAGIDVACENALPCFEKDGYNKILEIAKARADDPAGRKFTAMTYLRLCPELFEETNLKSFQEFVAAMHA